MKMAIRSFICTVFVDSPAAYTPFNQRHLKLRLTYFSLLFFNERNEFFHQQHKVKPHYIKKYDPLYVPENLPTISFHLEEGKQTKNSPKN